MRALLRQFVSRPCERHSVSRKYLCIQPSAMRVSLPRPVQLSAQGISTSSLVSDAASSGSPTSSSKFTRRTTSDDSGISLKALRAKRVQKRKPELPCKLRIHLYPHTLDKRTDKILAVLLDLRNWDPETEKALDRLEIRLHWRVVREVIKILSHVAVAVGFFRWASQQENFKHNTKTYAAIIRLVGESGDFKLMHSILLEMHQDRCVLTPFFFADIIMAYGSKQMVKEAYLVFERMKDVGCRPNRFVYNCLISTLSRAGYVEGAKLIHEKMSSIRGCEPDTVTCNMIIDNCGKSGDVLEAQRHLIEMKQTNIRPNEKSYASLIGNLCRAGRLEKACEIFHEIQSNSKLVNRVTYTELIRGLGKAGEVEKAVQLFRELESSGSSLDVVVYNILIDALGKHGSITEACNIFSAMEAQGYPPNVVTYNSIIRSFCKARRMDEAFQWYERMQQQRVIPDDHTYAILIGGFCKTGQWEVAYKFLVETEKRSNNEKVSTKVERDVQSECYEACFTKSVFVHNVMLDGLVKAQKLETAWTHFKTMQEKRCCPDVFSYSIIIHGLGNSGRATDVLQVYKQMKDSGLKPNLVTYNTLINVLGKLGRTFDVHKIVNEMVSLGLKPNIITYTCLLATVGRNREGSHRQENTVFDGGFDHIFGTTNTKK